MPPDTHKTSPLEGRRIQIRGIVQGVGFRPFVHRLAGRERITGQVRNEPGGAVIEAFGPPDALARFCAGLSAAPAGAQLRSLTWEPIAPHTCAGFEIGASLAGREHRISIPADLATCADCLAELFDPLNRRFHYPFTNCTECGPRFTIAMELPFDRALTAMARFAMCSPCRAEYDNPADRRFHAQAIACPLCGPRLWLADGAGHRIDTPDPLQAAAGALCEDAIVALKGLGGFHLACDASSSRAVSALRERKRREAKPFAVMVGNMAEAERIALLDPSERALLCSVERPIVLVNRRAKSGLAPELAPDSPLLGLMLAYTPLHHLLFAAAKRPLVMTSANRSEEPLAYRNDEALERLGSIADLFLLDDRDIVARCDDSVAR